MRNIEGKIIIKGYQLEDMVNILLENNYYIEIQKYNIDKVQLYIFSNNKKSEENK